MSRHTLINLFVSVAVAFVALMIITTVRVSAIAVTMTQPNQRVSGLITDTQATTSASQVISLLTQSASHLTTVTTGLRHTCRLKSDGSVDCWGFDDYGQVSQIPGNLPGAYIQVEAGGGHTCGLKSNGSVACWGSNDFGQGAPVPGNGPGTFVQLSAGMIHTCSLKSDGSVACWGDNEGGQVSPIPDNAPGVFSQVSSGRLHSCALKIDGSAVCWGSNWERQVSPVPGNGPGAFVQISAGEAHTCGLKPDGSVICWGKNPVGEVGPIPDKGPGAFKAVSAHSYFTCGLKTDDSVICWGLNSEGQVSPVPGNGPGAFARLGTGSVSNHTCGVKADDTLGCWGSTYYGQASKVDLWPYNLAGSHVYAPYTQLFVAHGSPRGWPTTHDRGDPPYTIDVISGILPPGLTLTSSGDMTATLSGTPLSMGTFVFTIRAIDVHNIAGTWTHILTVGKADPIVSLISTPNPAPSGQTITLTARVTGPGATPTGVVTFTEGITILGSSPLSNGVATFSVSGLSGYRHTFRAQYSGDDLYNSNVSNLVPQVIAQSIVYVPLIAHGDPSVTAFQLTFDPANDTEPVLSPDGQTIVFISDRAGQTDVFRTSITGGPVTNLTQTPLAQEDTPVFSPDGSEIAFASNRSGDWDIYLMNADGSNVRRTIGGVTDIEELHPFFTPDGTSLLYSGYIGGLYGNHTWDIYLATLDSAAGNWTRLTTDLGVDRFPSISADGQTIAFRSERDGNSEIYVMAADGSNVRRLTHDFAFDGYPVIAPDGGSVVFTSQRSGASQVYAVNLGGSGLITLTTQAGWTADMPRLSRDGRQLIYAARSLTGTYDVYLRPYDSSHP